MEKIPLILRIILWIYAFPIMLLIHIITKLEEKNEDKNSESTQKRMQDLIRSGRCPNCGKTMQKTPHAGGRDYYSCPSFCVNFSIKTGERYYKSNYFDEREPEKRFTVTSPYVIDYRVNEKHWDSDYSMETGIVRPEKARNIKDAFEALRMLTIEDTPITEEKFRADIEDGRKLIRNICPMCDRIILKRANFVKGYGENVTKLVKTGYGEYTVKTDYVGTYDHNVTTYTCGCSGVRYQLHEYEDNGMYYKKYSVTSGDNVLRRACAFSEIYTAKKTWLSQ